MVVLVERIDVLKLEIEGAERMLLEGIPEWLKRVDLLMIEMQESYEFSKLMRGLVPTEETIYEAGIAQAMSRREQP